MKLENSTPDSITYEQVAKAFAFYINEGADVPGPNLPAPARSIGELWSRMTLEGMRVVDANLVDNEVVTLIANYLATNSQKASE